MCDNSWRNRGSIDRREKGIDGHVGERVGLSLRGRFAASSPFRVTHVWRLSGRSSAIGLNRGQCVRRGEQILCSVWLALFAVGGDIKGCIATRVGEVHSEMCSRHVGSHVDHELLSNVRGGRSPRVRIHCESDAERGWSGCEAGAALQSVERYQKKANSVRVQIYAMSMESKMEGCRL